ncbi:predicted protein [Nematostella vectensis]|uniref:G-protein coupled receptors family 1 profile domain-containing protein n=1 Tax=Nematostella vectensis TaxID=45351 RepID=A7RP54_NEMVE|nr:octopamine receptor Oamb [Nematostella vectensis]XP_032219531.1 octopamine receptor Oamb [Nematostella vectensis]XP_048586603.1 octopamine receptor Oamb [Nematostella vectensis]EDO46796.1 predicted protein [Nematostella vectensis]|eukprot:XP_001638859.1 predicted protein [Nematostella vectensis]
MFGENECTKVTAPSELSFSTATLSILITLTAFPGNLLVILAIAIDPNKNLRSPFNFLVANLAVADCLVGLLVGPISAVWHMCEGLGRCAEYEAGVVRSIHMSFFISCTASLFSLAALAIDRFLAITTPLKYRLLLSPWRIALVSTVIWTVAVCFPLIYLEVGYIAYTFVFANTAVLATFGVLVFTYVKVFQSLRAQVLQWDQLGNNRSANGVRLRAVRWEQKITKTFLIMLALFIACYLPSCIVIYVMNLCNHCSCVMIHVLRDMQLILVMANSSMNPLVYAYRLKTFRSAFKKILQRCFNAYRRAKQGSFSLSQSQESSGL